MRVLLTCGVWGCSLLALLVAGLITAEFVFMATSMDPSDIVTAGVDSWTNAGIAVAALAGLAAMTLLSLGLWHSQRFRLVGLALTAIDVGLVAWASAKVYAEYF